MRRVLPVLFLVLFVPALASAQGSGSGGTSVLVTAEMPHQGSLPRTLTAYGTIEPAPGGGSETISLMRAGQVSRVLVAPGQAVHQGEKLVAVRAGAAVMASYQQAVAALNLAHGERDRTAEMLKQRLATRNQLAQAEKAVADAQATLDALKREGGGSSEQTFTAPFDGIVSSVLVAPGARVAADTPLITVTQTSQLVASVGIEPSQRALAKVGQQARIEPLYQGSPEQGRVTSVGAILDRATRLVPVLVDPPAPAAGSSPPDPKTEPGVAGLLPGTPVRVVVQIGEMQGWLVPHDAVLTDAKGAYLFQLNGGKAVRRDVSVVGMSGATTVVSGPIDPSQKLVTSGNYQLHGGETVREGPAQPGGGATSP